MGPSLDSFAYKAAYKNNPFIRLKVFRAFNPLAETQTLCGDFPAGPFHVTHVHLLRLQRKPM